MGRHRWRGDPDPGNLTGTPDELIAIRTPIARHVILIRRSSPASPPVFLHAGQITIEAPVTGPGTP